MHIINSVIAPRSRFNQIEGVSKRINHIRGLFRIRVYAMHEINMHSEHTPIPVSSTGPYGGLVSISHHGLVCPPYI